MDTGLTESSSDADTDKHYSQGGYQLLRNDVESDFAEDSLNPCVNIEVVETRNENVWSTGKKDDATQIEEKPKNTGYCYLTDDNEDPRENVSEATKSEMSKDDQNLLTVETGTTTEENTCSDSTVKVVTELNFDKENLPPVDNDKTPVAEIINSIAKDFKAAKDIDNRELTNVRLTKEIEAKDKDTKKVTNGDSGKSQAVKSERRRSRKDENPVEFDERYQGLKSNVDFKNAKDSIDVRKARRRSKPDVMAGQPLQIQQKPDLIQEGSLPIIDSTAAKKKESMVLNLTPDILYRKNVIQKERDVNQRLVHEMVMNKMKTLEKKRRSKERTSTGITGNENMGLWRSKTATDLFAHRRSNLSDGKAGASTEGICDSPSSTNVKTEAACSTPDVLLSTNIIPRLQSSKSAVDVKGSVSFLDKEINEYNNALKSFENADDKRPVSVFSTFMKEAKPVDLVVSMPEIFDAPKAPPRYNRSEDINRKLEKLKQNVKVRDKKREGGGERSYERHSWIEGSSEKDPRGSKTSLRKSCSKDGEDKKIHRRNSWLYSTTIMDGKSKSRKDVKGAAAGIEKMRRGSSESVLKVKRSKSFSEICDKDKGSANINVGKYTLVEIDADTVCKSDPNILEVGDQKIVEGEKQAGSKKKKDRERRKSITKMFATLFTRKSLVNLSELRNSAEMEEKPISRKSLSETSIQRNLVTPPPIPPLPKNYHAVRMTDDSSDGELECRRLSSCDTLDRSGTFESSVPGARSSSKALKAARQSQLKSDCDCAGKDETELLREWFALMRDRQELRRYERELTDRAKELELEDRYHRLERDMRDRLSIENDIQTEVGI
nr:unnamed protein product [Callosobruchus chinensis]